MRQNMSYLKKYPFVFQVVKYDVNYELKDYFIL